MQHITTILYQETGATLTAYLHDPSPEMSAHTIRPAVLICPGGAYAIISDREKDPVAYTFLGMGYHVFTLTYSVQGVQSMEESYAATTSPLGWQPLVEVASAIQYIREHASQLRVQSNQIALCGFSAGGHLAGSLGVHYNHPTLLKQLNTTASTLRPDALVLCYPVITTGSYTHVLSMVNLLGLDPTAEEVSFFSLEKQVSADTPPTFLWHTVDDDTVPVENALLMATSLQKHRVPFELHLFPHGIHGSSICTEEVNTPNAHAHNWLLLCHQWLNTQF